MKLNIISYSYLLLISFSCAVKDDFFLTPPTDAFPDHSDQLFHTFYFLGGSDNVKLDESKIGQMLARQTEESGKNSTLLLLGNNSLRNQIFRRDSSKQIMEKRELLRRRYEFFNGLKGKYYAVLGPHEWANGNRRGMENALTEKAQVPPSPHHRMP